MSNYKDTYTQLVEELRVCRERLGDIKEYITEDDIKFLASYRAENEWHAAE